MSTQPNEFRQWVSILAALDAEESQEVVYPLDPPEWQVLCVDKSQKKVIEPPSPPMSLDEACILAINGNRLFPGIDHILRQVFP